LAGSNDSTRDRARLLVLVLGVVAMLGVRLHVLDDELPNPDIAGIVYNAELILDGGLPYVDTAEIKPPGAFVLAAISIAVLGRSLEALQLWHAIWLLLGGLGMWWAARAIYDEDDEPQLGPRCAAVAVAVYLVSVAMFSYNYSSWMTPASALAVGATLRGLKRDRGRDHVVAGAFALLAFVTIQRAAVLALLLPALWFWARRRRWPGARPRAFGLWVLGASLGLSPLFIGYALAGEATTLLGALLPLSVAADYTSVAQQSGVGIVLAVFVQLVKVFWFPVGLIVLGLVALSGERDRAWSSFVPAALWLLASIVGAGLGGARYYLHYLVQYAPALALAVGHPALIRMVGRASSASTEGRVRVRLLSLGVAVLVLAQFVEIGLGQGHRYEAMARRLTGGLTAAQAAGAHIRERTSSDDTIFVWGWTAWRVYYWAQRRSPSRVYKPLGSLTTFNTNTAFEPGSGIVFRDGPLARELVEAFDRNPPEYFVYSPSMVQAFGARPDPIEGFEALRERISADYLPEAQFGDLRLFRRRR